MSVTLTSLGDLERLGFDDIIDVRSPAEYAEDHLPGAINLPVMSDEERARVGTIYVQESPFKARKIGAAIVARNAAAHLEGPLAAKGGGWRPLVYCWRGGQRSGSFATILSQIGWRVARIEGGYKAWRSLVVRALYDTPVASPICLLDGDTGAGKTEVLKLLPEFGVQVIDLEGLAHHRGSLFGAMGPQPSQRAFEGALALALDRLDPTRPVVIEAESAKVGDRNLPPRLWKALMAAPRIALSVPVAERAAFSAAYYGDLTAAPQRLLGVLDKLRPFHPAERIEDWIAMVLRGDFVALAAALMRHHYDPRYARQRARARVPWYVIEAESLSPEGLRSIAERVAAKVEELWPRARG